MNLSTWLRKRHTPLLWHEITLILLIKVVLIFVIWAVWFDHPMPREQRAAGTARIILNR